MSPYNVDRCVFGFIPPVALVAALLSFAIASWPARASDQAIDDMVAQAHKATMSGRPAEAVTILRKAIDQAPTRADLYLMRSRANDSAGKMNAALDDANQYIQLEPNDPYGYLNRARVYMSMEKNQTALEDANKAISLAPDEPDGYFRRADIYVDMGKDAEAKADEAKADELDKKSR